MGVCTVNEFKKGDKIWWFRTHGYHGEIQTPDDWYLQSDVITEVDDDYGSVGLDDEIWMCSSDLARCYKSKREALEALSRRLKELLDAD